MKLSVSRVSQLPTSVCPQFEHTWNVDIESASTATTCTYKCRFESGEVSHVSRSCRQTRVHNINTNEMCADLNQAKYLTSLAAADRRVSTISTQMKCWYRICIYCYDMYLQLQNWMKLNVSRVSQLPTSVCRQFEHTSNVDIESAFTATTCTDNCKIEWS